MPIVLNGSTGITANNLGVETIVDTAGTGAPSVPNGFEQMFVLPVGTLMWFTGTTAPGGYLVADGSLHSRAAYPDLWSWIVTSGNLAVSDALWTDGQYSPGDGATTFRLPKVDNRFIRGKSATRVVGLVEEDAFQGHTFAGDAGTPFRDIGIYITQLGGTRVPSLLTTSPGNDLHIISDGTNGTPRTANETRPKALTMLPCIKAFDSVIEPSILNAAEMVSTINGKLDKDQNIVLGTSVVASGTAVDFVGIPEGVKRITVMFDGMSLSGASDAIIQLGSGDIEASGYKGAGVTVAATSLSRTYTTGFGIYLSNSANTFQGSVLLSEIGNGVFVCSGSGGLSNFPNIQLIGGSKTLSGPLDRIRITTVNGTDVFDAGTINISWEF